MVIYILCNIILYYDNFLIIEASIASDISFVIQKAIKTSAYHNTTQRLPIAQCQTVDICATSLRETKRAPYLCDAPAVRYEHGGVVRFIAEMGLFLS